MTLNLSPSLMSCHYQTSHPTVPPPSGSSYRMPLDMELWTNPLDGPGLLQFSKPPSASAPGDTGPLHADKAQVACQSPRTQSGLERSSPLNVFMMESLPSSASPCSNSTFSGVHFLTLPGRINCALSVPSICGAHFDYNTCHIIARMSDACLRHPGICALSP